MTGPGTRNGEVCIFPPSFWAVLTLSWEGGGLPGVVAAGMEEHLLPAPGPRRAGACAASPLSVGARTAAAVSLVLGRFPMPSAESSGDA